MATARQGPQLTLGGDDRPDVTDRSRPLGPLVSTDTPGPIHESLSVFLADLLAWMHDVEPTDGPFQLYDHVDPDALDALFDHARTHEQVSWRFEFDVGEQTVVVDSDGHVILER